MSGYNNYPSYPPAPDPRVQPHQGYAPASAPLVSGPSGGGGYGNGYPPALVPTPNGPPPPVGMSYDYDSRSRIPSGPPPPVPYNAGPTPPDYRSGGGGGYGGGSYQPQSGSYGAPPPPPLQPYARDRNDRPSMGRERSPDGRGYNNGRLSNAGPGPGPGPGPVPRRDRDRDSDRSASGPGRDVRSVSERIQLERQCRTLFVRNVSYDADVQRLKTSFESYGEISNWFDMISRRGMVFVTYFDLRVAQKAKDGMHGVTIGPRKIDVHFSLPKDEETNQRCDRTKNQGSILIILRYKRPHNMDDLAKMCESFGEIKSLRPCKDPAHAIVEYWDSRGAALFHDKMNDQPYGGSSLDLKFIWDEPPPGHGGTNDRVRRESADDRRRGSSGGGLPPGPPGHRDRYSSGPSGPLPPQNRYGDVPPPAPVLDDRLEQARKVQQLLANIGNVAPPPPGPGPPPPTQSPYNPSPSSNVNGRGPLPPQGQIFSGMPPPSAGPGPSPGSYQNQSQNRDRPGQGGYGAPPPLAPPSRSNDPRGGYNDNRSPAPSAHQPHQGGYLPAGNYGNSAPPLDNYSRPDPRQSQNHGQTDSYVPSNNYQSQTPPAPARNQGGYRQPSPSRSSIPPPTQSGYDPRPAPPPPQAYQPQNQGGPGYSPHQGYQPPPQQAPGQGYSPNQAPVAVDPRSRPPPPQQQQQQQQQLGSLLAMLQQGKQ